MLQVFLMLFVKHPLITLPHLSYFANLVFPYYVDQNISFLLQWNVFVNLNPLIYVHHQVINLYMDHYVDLICNYHHFVLTFHNHDEFSLIHQHHPVIYIVLDIDILF